jgi:hypothetical protein
MPTGTQMMEDHRLEEYILSGWLPEAPFITRQHITVAFGSCFAHHVRRQLREWGYGAITSHETGTSHGQPHIAGYGDGMVNTFTVLQQFEWAWQNRQFPEDVWFHDAAEPAADREEESRLETKTLLDTVDVFILTFGLSEVWYDKATGNAFWKAIPASRFDPEKHAFRVCSCAETIANISKIIQLIKENRPAATIILTLSPVGLLATFRPVSCITANSASKAILRAAIDEVIRARPDDKQLFYWPSYEIVTQGYTSPYKIDRRHPRPAVIKKIMELFKKYYLVE